jgi:hypothetical protein
MIILKFPVCGPIWMEISKNADRLDPAFETINKTLREPSQCFAMMSQPNSVGILGSAT